jgi:hypothetical protein
MHIDLQKNYITPWVRLLKAFAVNASLVRFLGEGVSPKPEELSRNQSSHQQT